MCRAWGARARPPHQIHLSHQLRIALRAKPPRLAAALVPVVLGTESVVLRATSHERRVLGFVLSTTRLVPSASRYGRRATCEGPRASCFGLRASGEEPSATFAAPRTKCSARSAWPRNRRVPFSGRRNRKPRPIADRKQGAGVAVPEGGEGLREAEGPFSPVRVLVEGVTPSPKKNPRARLPRAHAVGPAGRSGRVPHDRFVLVSWFRWLFASHGNSFRNSSRTNTPRGKTTSETS